MKRVYLTVMAFLIIGLLTGCCMEHQWQDATCSAPKTCAKCGKTEGEALPHTWQEATCQAPKTCAVCQAVEGEKGDHVWQDATCTAAKTCTLCAATEGELLPHDWQEATMDLPQTCNACGATEGTAKNYFAVNGLEVQETLPESFDSTCIIWKLNNVSSQEQAPCKFEDAHYYYMREDGENFKMVQLRFQVKVDVRVGGPKGQNAYLVDYNLFDRYTGQVIPYVDDPLGYHVSLEIDGKPVEYTIYWGIGSDNAEYGDKLEDGTQIVHLTKGVYINTSKVPEDYYGLVLAVGQLKNTTQQQEWRNMEKEGAYAADYFEKYADFYDGVTFYGLTVEEETPW